MRHIQTGDAPGSAWPWQNYVLWYVLNALKAREDLSWLSRRIPGRESVVTTQVRPGTWNLPL